MKKVLLAILISSALIGCGGDDSSSLPTQPEFDICAQVKLADGVVLDLEVRDMPDGSKEYGYYDNEEFVLHRDCNDEPAVYFKSAYSPEERKIWLQKGEHYRIDDKPNAVFVGGKSSPYYRSEEWREGAWLSLDELNDDNYHLYTYKDRGDKPNIVHSEIHENGELIRLTYEVWKANFRDLHRVNGPAYISYYDYNANYNKDGVIFSWMDQGKLLKDKYIQSGNFQCRWTVESDDWSGSIETQAPNGSTACKDEAELDKAYLVWGDSPITAPPLSKKTYEFLFDAGIDEKEANEICKSNEHIKVNCSNVYSDDNMQIIMNSKTSMTAALINGITVLNDYSQFGYNINLEYEDDISFELANNWRVESEYNSLGIHYVTPDEYGNSGTTTLDLLDISSNVLGSVDSRVQVETYYDDNNVLGIKERNYLYLQQSQFSSVFDFEPADISIITGALPVIDEQQVELEEYVMIGESSKAFASALNRAKLINEYRNN